MQIISNESLINRNARIGQIAMIAGLVVLLGGMYLSFTNPDNYIVSFGALIVGFLLSQVGIYYSNRWGRRPRPDEILDKSLKGLDNKYTLYHFKTPVPHLLIGPAGIWVLLPKHQGGTITYANGRYRQKGGNLYLKLFAQEGLGRPEMEVMNEVSIISKKLQETFQDEPIPPVNSMLIFTNPKVTLDISEEEDPPARSVLIGKVKEEIRKEAKTKPISQDQIEIITEKFSKDKM